MDKKYKRKNKNYFIKEINQNELMSKKQKKASKTSNDTEHSFMLVSAIITCASIFTFAFLVGISVGISSSAFRLKIYSIAARSKKCKLLIK